MKSALKYFREIIYLVGEDKKKLPWLIALVFVSSFLDVVGLGLIGSYVSLVINPDNFIQGPIGKFIKYIGFNLETNSLLIGVGLSLICAFLFKAIIAIYIKFYIARFCENRKVKLRTFLMNSYQKLPYSVFIQRNSAEYIRAIQVLVDHFIGSVLQSLLVIITSFTIALAITIFLVLISGAAPVLLVTILLFLIFIYDQIFSHRVKIYGEKANRGAAIVIQAIQEGIEGLKEIRILGKTSYFQQMVKIGAEKVSKNAVKADIISTAPRYLLEIILVFFVVSYVFLSLYEIIPGENIIANIGMFGMASIRILPLANQIIHGITHMRFGQYATSELYADLKKLENLDSNKLTNQKLQEVTTFHKLSLNNLYFHYPNTKKWALNNINFSIEAGDSIGIIGPSGAGKTTLMDVLLGLLEPQKGEINYNGDALKNTIDEWRAQVAYIPQETFLIDNTLRFNIAIGLEDNEIDNKKLNFSLEQAKLTEVVRELPQGVDTMLGERGVRLSGGQRQRISIARAFYHDRNVLVMDEATSALDDKTEQKIVQEIKRLKKQKTLIVIAHRLSTVEHCDKICQLENGKIIQIGTFKQVV